MSINVVDHWELSIHDGRKEIDLKSDIEPEVVVFGVETYIKIQTGLRVKHIKTSEMMGFSITPITKDEIKQP